MRVYFISTKRLAVLVFCIAFIFLMLIAYHAYSATVTIWHAGGKINCTLKEPGIVWSPDGRISMSCVENYAAPVQPPPQPIGVLDPSCYARCMAFGSKDTNLCKVECTK